MGRQDLRVIAPIAFGIAPDDKDPDRYTVNVSQAGLGLPGPDYYLKPEAGFAGARDKYRAYVEAMLSLAGAPEPTPAAASILALETAIAALHWPAEKRGDRNLAYNPKTRAGLSSSGWTSSAVAAGDRAMTTARAANGDRRMTDPPGDGG